MLHRDSSEQRAIVDADLRKIQNINFAANLGYSCNTTVSVIFEKLHFLYICESLLDLYVKNKTTVAL